MFTIDKRQETETKERDSIVEVEWQSGMEQLESFTEFLNYICNFIQPNTN